MNVPRTLGVALLAAALVGCGEQPEPARPPPERTAEATPHPRHGEACRAAGFPTRWDAEIAKASRRYLPHAWQVAAPCGLRAQLAAESGLDDAWCRKANPHGTSASCLGQLTTAAAHDVERRAGILHSRTQPQSSIRAAAFYLARQRGHWTEPRSEAARRTLAVATYHGGLGTLLDGQRAARAAGKVARTYEEIGPYIPEPHGAANRMYVARVERLRQEMTS